MTTHAAAPPQDAAHSAGPNKPVIATSGWIAIVVGATIVGMLVVSSLMRGDHAAEHAAPEMPRMWLLGVLPFVAILACIALLPLISATHHWWESNLNRLGVSIMAATATIGYYWTVAGIEHVVPVLEHAIVAEYIPFIVLLFSLYVITGGISIQGDLPAHPLTNTAFLATGAAIASVVGTTGASMLLIRPILQTNAERRHVVHTVVFFIFLVSNVGGTLLPIGDPPLFLGYLNGVPFFWTLGLWKEWALCCVILLVIYYVWDTRMYKKELPRDIRKDETTRKPLRLRGGINLLWLLGVVVAVAFISDRSPLPGTNFTPFPFMRELVMLGFVALSLKATPKVIREDNNFNYAAILEVAALFIGIFIAMQVPVQVLNVSGPDLGLNKPWHFFWTTGSLSSVLDNAPTYVVFFQTANAMTHSPGPGILQLVGGHFMREDLLIGISLGAVFMGAMTYIGNGPNFMVKAIAEQSGIKMPSFFGYMFKYSLPILIPVFVLITILFLL